MHRLLPRGEQGGRTAALCPFAGHVQDGALTRLALDTLGSFNFGSIALLPFAAEHVLPYLDDPEVHIRKAAALAAVRVLSRAAEAARPTRPLVSPPPSQPRPHTLPPPPHPVPCPSLQGPMTI